ncbi:phage tail protein [Escherichia coli]
MKGLENAIRNLNSLDTRMVPQASAWAINRVAQKAVSVATRQVAGNTVAGDNQVKGIPLKLVRQRVRVFKASPSGKMTARIRVNRGNLPAIKLGMGIPTSPVSRWCSGPVSRSRLRRRNLNPPAPRRCWVRK